MALKRSFIWIEIARSSAPFDNRVQDDDKGKHKYRRKLSRTAGAVYAAWNCGIIFGVQKLVRGLAD